MQKNTKSLFFVMLFSFISYFLESEIRFLCLKNSFFINNSVFSIRYAENTGGAWNILNNNTLFLSVLGIFVIIAILFYVFKYLNFEENKIEIFTLSLFVSGVLGNTIQRILNGFVIDYFKLNFIDFPVFNLFDIFIVCAVIFYFIAILRQLWCKKK